MTYSFKLITFADTIRRAAQETGGASAIEFAFIATIFFTLVFGIIVYGAYFGSLGLVNHIAYEAARASMAGLSDSERTQLAEARASELVAAYSGLLDADTVQVEAGPTGNGIFEVTVSQEFDAFGLADTLTFMPLPPTTQTATVEISNGGY
jgi:Flp pilus assembly protein TadG